MSTKLIIKLIYMVCRFYYLCKFEDPKYAREHLAELHKIQYDYE